METSRLLKFQYPKRAQSLLESLAYRDDLLPRGARRIAALDELPTTLQVLAGQHRSSESAWLSWTDGRHIWFFAASPSLALSRERRKPVLVTSVFDTHGSLIESTNWVFTDFSGWQKCA